MYRRNNIQICLICIFYIVHAHVLRLCPIHVGTLGNAEYLNLKVLDNYPWLTLILLSL
jgi:hypothetical protein